MNFRPHTTLKYLLLAALSTLAACNLDNEQGASAPSAPEDTAVSTSGWQGREQGVIVEGMDDNEPVGRFLFGGGVDFGPDNWRFRIEAFHPDGIEEVYLRIGKIDSLGAHPEVPLCTAGCGLDGSTTIRGWVSGISPWEYDVADGEGQYFAELHIVGIEELEPNSDALADASFSWAPATLAIDESSTFLGDGALAISWSDLGQNTYYTLTINNPDDENISTIHRLNSNAYAFDPATHPNPDFAPDYTSFPALRVSVEAVNASGVIAQSDVMTLEYTGGDTDPLDPSDPDFGGGDTNDASSLCLFMPAVLYADQADNLTWDVDPWSSLGDSTISINGWSGALSASLSGTELSFSAPEPGLYGELDFTVSDSENNDLSYGPYSLEIKPAYSTDAVTAASSDTFEHYLSRADAFGRQWLIGDDPVNTSRLVLIRLTEQGVADGTFGTAGRKEIDLRGFTSFPTAMDVDNTRIIAVTAKPLGADWLIGGYVELYDANSIIVGHSAFLMRVDSNGDPVTEFADNGLWYFEESGLHLEVGAILVNGPDEILVALNTLDWASGTLRSEQTRILKLDKWAEAPDFDLGVLIDLNSALNLRVRAIAPVPKNSESFVLAGLGWNGTASLISSARVIFNGSEWAFDGDYSASTYTHYSTTTSIPTVTDSLITPQGYLWLTGKQDTDDPNSQLTFAVALSLTGVASESAILQNMGFGITQPIGLMQGTDEDVLLTVANSPFGSYELTSYVFNNPLDLNNPLNFNLDMGSGNYETDVRGAVAPGNRILMSYRLSSAQSVRRVARYLPYALDNNQGLEEPECGVVALRESNQTQDDMYPPLALQSSFRVNTDDYVVLSDESASPRLRLARLIDGKRWDLSGSEALTNSLMAGSSSGAYDVVYHPESNALLASVFSNFLFDDDGLGSNYTSGVVSLNLSDGQVTPLFGTAEIADFIVLMPDGTGNTPISLYANSASELIIRSELEQFVENESLSGSLRFAHVDNDGYLWLVLSKLDGDSTFVQIQRRNPISHPTDPLAVAWDETLPLPASLTDNELPLGFTLDDENRGLLLSSDSPDGPLIVRRILSNTGAVDGSFATGGTFAVNEDWFNTLPSRSGRMAQGLVVDGMGRAYFPAAFFNGDDNINAVFRLTDEGILDNGFGVGGRVELPSLGFNAIGSFAGVKLGTLDEIQALWEIGGRYEIVQLTPEGHVDRFFGNGGMVRIGSWPDEIAMQLGTDASGRMFPLMRQQDFSEVSSVYWGLRATGARIQDFGNLTIDPLRDLGSVNLSGIEASGLQPTGQNTLILSASEYSFDVGEFSQLYEHDLALPGEDGNPTVLSAPWPGPADAEFDVSLHTPFVDDAALLGGYFYSATTNDSSYFIARINRRGEFLSLPFGPESPDIVFVFNEPGSYYDLMQLQYDGSGVIYALVDEFDDLTGTSSPAVLRFNAENPEGEPFYSHASGDGTAITVDNEGRLIVAISEPLGPLAAEANLIRLDAMGEVDSSWTFTTTGDNTPERIWRLLPVGDALFIGGANSNGEPFISRINSTGSTTHQWSGSQLVTTDAGFVVDFSLDPRGHLNVLQSAFKDGQWQTVISRIPAAY
ncbi:hypothetical protein NFC81_06435 [Salinispirillum sp. LH 10-3-1]|uniref:Uncharacterized protein n=1 Tax=Salinispirillum sp. LH 10-3-1 TaxID=2952525 RepID=A0AB38YJ71_9GAMM